MQLNRFATALARIASVATPVVAAFALAACASTPLTSKAPVPVVTATQTPVGSSSMGSSSGSQPAVATALAPGYLDPNSPLQQQRSVYFAYDAASFRSQDKAVVELHGRYLADHPAVHVTVAGNSDERGGSEYNLALGQRRAESVKSALEVLGVKDTQIEPVSYGKEKPKALGHDEAAWQQNRRVDFVYPSN